MPTHNRFADQTFAERWCANFQKLEEKSYEYGFQKNLAHAGCLKKARLKTKKTVSVQKQRKMIQFTLLLMYTPFGGVEVAPMRAKIF